MKWVGWGVLALALAWPAARADDKPKEDKKDAPAKDKDEKKEPTLQEQYNALVKDFNSQRNAIVAEAQKAKADEQQKLFQKYQAVGKEFAEKFYKLAEEDPKGTVGQDSLFWVIQNGGDSPVVEKASEKVKAVVAEMPLKELNTRLSRLQAHPALVEAVLQRAEKDEDDTAAGDLVAWAAIRGAQKAIDRLIEKYPDHPMVERAVRALGRMDDGEAKLKAILEKDPKPKVKAAAALGLGRVLVDKTDELAEKPAEADKVAAEGEKYLTMAIDLSKDNKVAKEDAESVLRALRTLRVGKEAPDIKGGDLDGKEFKLSDYRGKVVMLDFWGNW